MKQLPNDVRTRIGELRNEAAEQKAAGEYSATLETLWRAWNLIPEPQTEWFPADSLLTSIGDANFLAANYEAARESLTDAIKWFGEDAFSRLRLGQSYFELGIHDRAAENLASAFRLDGAAIFRFDDAGVSSAWINELKRVSTTVLIQIYSALIPNRIP